MRKEYFLSRKQIRQILKIYGGARKYTLNEMYTQILGKLVFSNRRNNAVWLVISQNKEGVVVEIFNFTMLGNIRKTQDVYKNQLFTIEDLSKVEKITEREHLIKCEEDASEIDNEYMRIMDKYDLWEK